MGDPPHLMAIIRRPGRGGAHQPRWPAPIRLRPAGRAGRRRARACASRVAPPANARGPIARPAPSRRCPLEPALAVDPADPAAAGGLGFDL